MIAKFLTLLFHPLSPNDDKWRYIKTLFDLVYFYNILFIYCCTNCFSDSYARVHAQGAFGTCHLCTLLPEKRNSGLPQNLMLKISKNWISSLNDTLISEMHLTKNLNSMYLVRIYNSYLEADSHRQIYPHIIMEYCPDGSLETLINTYSAKQEHIPEQVLSPLSYYFYIFYCIFRYYYYYYYYIFPLIHFISFLSLSGGSTGVLMCAPSYEISQWQRLRTARLEACKYRSFWQCVEDLRFWPAPPPHPAKWYLHTQPRHTVWIFHFLDYDFTCGIWLHLFCITYSAFCICISGFAAPEVYHNEFVFFAFSIV